MTEQRAFSWPAATGRADPATSREAEIRITRSGTRQTHAERVLAVVTAAPGLTAPAIADRAGLSHVAAQRRLSDLAQMGRLAQGGQ